MEVKVSNNEGETQDQARLCLICKKQFSKYTCPKCAVGYCSLPCYKNHSSRCTTSFYEDNVVQMLKSHKVSDEEKLKMFMTLKKFEQNNNVDIVEEMMKAEDDEEGEDDEEATISKLQSLNLDSTDVATILSMLTQEQREEFQKSILDGKIGNWMDVWEPWWCNEGTKPLVTPIINGEIEDELKPEEKVPTPIPTLEESLPKLNTITTHPPSPMLSFNLVEILYAYVYTQRLFNGDCASDPFDAATTLSTLSSVLCGNAVHASCVSALNDVVRRSLLPPISATKEFAISALLDTANLLSRKQFVLAALSDLHRLFRSVSAADPNSKQITTTTSTKTTPSTTTTTTTTPTTTATTTTNKETVTTNKGSPTTITTTTTTTTPKTNDPKKTTKGTYTNKQIVLQTKKVYFYLVWANEQDERRFEQLEGEARAEWETQCEILQQKLTISTSNTKSKDRGTTRPVIEEIQ